MIPFAFPALPRRIASLPVLYVRLVMMDEWPDLFVAAGIGIRVPRIVEFVVGEEVLGTVRAALEVILAVSGVLEVVAARVAQQASYAGACRADSERTALAIECGRLTRRRYRAKEPHRGPDGRMPDTPTIPLHRP